ncbi:MAG: S41 family peptidase [Bacteroidota bacterium]
MNTSLKNFTLFCFILSVSSVFGQVDQRVYTVAELHEDWDIFRHELETMHPGLNLYTSKTAMDATFDRVKASINHPMTAAEFYPYLAQMNPYIKNGHTVIRPSAAFDEYVATKAPILPLDVHWHGDSLFVLRNMTNEMALEPGTYLRSINGKDAWTEFMDIAGNWNRDGENTSFPKGIIARAFAEIYANFRGFPEQFDLEIVDAQGQTQQLNIAPMPADERAAIRTERYGEVYHYWDKSQGDALTLHFEENLAIITLRHCGNTDVREFMKTIKGQYRRIFKEIIASGVQNLVIDIRNNPGGNQWPTIYLMRHLAKQPFYLYQQDYLIGRTLSEYYDAPRFWYNTLGSIILSKNEDGTYYANWLAGVLYGKHRPKLRQPSDLQFNGQVYTLTNYATFSAGGYLAGMLEQHTNSIFIGEEPGGNANECIAGESFDLVLPNTKNRVLMQIVHSKIVVDRENNGHGVEPDYPVRPTATQLHSGVDPEMDLVRSLIQLPQQQQTMDNTVAGKK